MNGKTVKKKNLRKNFTGVCKTCGIEMPVTSYKAYCAKCNKKKNDDLNKYYRERKNKFKEQGLCTYCGKNRNLEHSQFCYECYFAQTSFRVFKTREHKKMLQQKWEEQEGKCYYSGIKMILGKTASIEHKTPKSRCLTFNDIENITWTLKSINTFKLTMLESEFLILIENIYNHSVQKQRVKS